MLSWANHPVDNAIYASDNINTMQCVVENSKQKLNNKWKKKMAIILHIIAFVTHSWICSMIRMVDDAGGECVLRCFWLLKVQ